MSNFYIKNSHSNTLASVRYDGNANNNNSTVDSLKIRKFFKLHNAVAQLQDSINCIYNNAFTDDEILELQSASATSEKLNQAILNSPTISITNYLMDLKNDLDFNELFKDANFELNNSPVHNFIRYPVVTDSNLEKLAFIHKSFPNMSVKLTETEKIIMSNERLEFLGDAWLGALVSYIIYTKYPYANEGSLSKMKSAIVNNNNLEKLCTKLGFKDRLKENVPRFSLKIKDKFSKYYADCVEAYIGALVVDRFSTEFKEVADWLEELSEEHFIELGPEMLKKPLNKNAKGELAELLQFNNVGGKINYRRLNNDSPFTVEVLIGDTVLAQGVGQNVREAEQRAAMEVLADEDLIQKYCSYEIEKNYIEEEHLVEEAHENAITEKQDIKAVKGKTHRKVENEISQSTNIESHVVKEDTYPDESDDDVGAIDDVDKLTQQIMAKMGTMISSIVTDTIKKNESRRASKVSSRRNSIATKSKAKRMSDFELKFNDNASDIAPHDTNGLRNLRNVPHDNKRGLDRPLGHKLDNKNPIAKKVSVGGNINTHRDINLNRVNGIKKYTDVNNEDSFKNEDKDKENHVDENVSRGTKFTYNVKTEPFKPTRLLASKLRTFENVQEHRSESSAGIKEFNPLPPKVNRSASKTSDALRSSHSTHHEESSSLYASSTTDTIKVPKYFRNGSISFVSSNIPKTPTPRTAKSMQTTLSNKSNSFNRENTSSEENTSFRENTSSTEKSNSVGLRGNINDHDDFDESNYDKNASGELYALLGSINLFPSYEITEIAPAKFHSICAIQGVGTILGEGIGRNKKMAQHISANYALYSQQLQSIIGD